MHTPRGGLGCGLGLLALLLLSCCQLAAAQNYTALRQGVWLPPLCKIDNITEAKEYDGLLEKLPQIKNTPAEQQLQLLSANSRSKLNNLTGNAAEWLKNRTDSELEELFENVRAENFRRVMAMAAIGTQLRKAFTSVNVLGTLELLQTEDLERLASLPLFEDKYQRLTNVTFLELMRKVYDFGLTQVTERTCIATAANTSSVSRLPNADPSTAQINTTSFASLKLEPEPVTRYSILSSGRRLRSSSHRRRTLLQVFSKTASSWLHLDHQEAAAAAVVREVTAGPGSSGNQARKLLYLPQSVDGSTAAPADHTVAPIVARFLEGLQETTWPDGEKTFELPEDPNKQDTPSLLAAAGGIPGLSTQPGFLDSRMVSRGCTENLGRFLVRTAADGSLVGVASTAPRPSSGSSGSGSGTTSSGSTAPTATQLGIPLNSLVQEPRNASTPTNTTNLVATPTACGGSVNGSAGNGTVACGSTAPLTATVSNATALATPNALVANASAVPPVAAAVNATTIDAFPVATAVNATDLPMPALVAPASLNATGLPAIDAILPTAGTGLGNDTIGLAAPQVLPGDGPAPAPAPAPEGNITDGGDAILPADQALIPPADLPAAAPLAPGPTANATDILPQAGTVLPLQDPAAPANPASPAPGADVAVPSPLPEIATGEVITPATVISPDAAGMVAPAAAVAPTPTPTDQITNNPGVLVDPAAQVVPPVTAIAADAAAVDPAAAVLPAQQPAVVPPPAEVPSAAVVPSAGVVTPELVAPTVLPTVEQPPALVAPTTPVEPVQTVAPVTVLPANVAPPPPAPVPVACVGSWTEPTGPCNAPCEAAGFRISTFVITVQAADGGAPCPVADGKPREVPCTSDVACPKPPVPCVGAWTEPTGPCNAPCESAGTRASIFTVTTPEANGGAPCEAASGAVREVPCTSDVACPKPPVPCVGAWAETGPCNAPCESAGTRASIFTVTTPEANGGAPCEAASGAVREVPCSNPEPCPKPQLALEPVPTPPPVVPPPPEPVPQPAAVVPVAVEPAAAAAAEAAAAAAAPTVTVLQP